MRNLTPNILPPRLVGLSTAEHNLFGLEERLYTAKEIASRLGVSERWIRDHATRRNPRIRAIKLGPLVRFRWTDVQIFIAELAEKTHTKSR